MSSAKKVFIDYMISYKEVKEEYLTNDESLWRLLYQLFASCKDIDIKNSLLTELNDVKDKIPDLIKQRFPGKDGDISEDAITYENYSIRRKDMLFLF